MVQKIDKYEGIVDEKLTICRDYSSIMEWSVGKSQILSKNEWSDYTITDPGVLALSMIAYLYDHVNYEMDAVFLNNLIRYTNNYDILLLMASFMGIKAPLLEASLAVVEVSTKDGSNGIYLPANYAFKIFDRSLGKDIFYNIRDEVNVVDSDKVEVSCVEGIYDSIIIDPSDISQVDGYHQSFFYDDSIAGNVAYVSSFNNSNPSVRTAWVMSDNAFLATKELLQFSMHRHNSSEIRLRYIPGMHGELALVNHNRLLVEMYSTGGAKGRLGVGSVLEPGEDIIVGGNNVTHNIQAEVLDSFGGTNPLTIEELRTLIGSKGSEVLSNVTVGDYMRISEADRRVLKVSANAISGEGMGIYYLTDQTYDVATINNIEENIEGFLDGRLPLFTSDVVKGYNLSYVDVGDFISISPLTMEIYLKNNEVDTDLITGIINNYINYRYSRERSNFGENFSRFGLRREIEDLHESISHVFIINPADDIMVSWNKIVATPTTIITYKATDIDMGGVE